MEAAAVAGGMLRGEVEPLHTPRNALDILAQQLVAMVSVEPWSVPALYDLVRGAYPYTDLTSRAFQAVLEMLAGRFPFIWGCSRNGSQGNCRKSRIHSVSCRSMRSWWWPIATRTWTTASWGLCVSTWSSGSVGY